MVDDADLMAYPGSQRVEARYEKTPIMRGIIKWLIVCTNEIVLSAQERRLIFSLPASDPDMDYS